MTMFRTFAALQSAMETRFRSYAKKVHTEKWQGSDISKRPDMVSWELLNQCMEVNLFGIESLKHWRNDIQPNLPWADDHFEERVCGAPLNPGTEWANWPWATSADKHREDGMFNHTYAERLWPKYAGRIGATTTAENAHKHLSALTSILTDSPHYGIRHPYGDLRSLVEKLANEPLTRQAYIPLYFPEDTGLDGRMPCTLGYQFIMREGALHIYYPLRSCDFVRHWRDDCYLAVRLLLWMLDECRKIDPRWNDIKPGTYTMHCVSLHVFANDWQRLIQGQKL